MKRHYEDVSDCVTQRRLLLAAEEVLKTKAITPLLKEELRLSIITRRHAQGAEFIKTEFKEPEMHELTADEVEKKARRREQNRRAAQKCRMKKKKKQDGWIQNFSTIVQENEKLALEIETLKRQKMELNAILQQHVLSGECWYSQPCSNIQDSSHDSHHSTCDVTQTTLPEAAQLWLENNRDSRVVQTSDSYSKNNEDIDQMLNLCSMDFPAHSQMYELFDDLTADSLRQGASTSSTSSDGDGLASYAAMEAGLSDPLQDDDVFQEAALRNPLQDDDVFQEAALRNPLQDNDVFQIAPQLGEFQPDLSQCLNPVSCERQITNEKCFFSEP